MWAVGGEGGGARDKNLRSSLAFLKKKTNTFILYWGIADEQCCGSFG